MKKSILSLILTLGLLTSYLSQTSKNPTLSTNQDSILCLSPYETQLVNLDHTAMLYWSKTSANLDTLYRLEQKKVYELRNILSYKDDAINSLQDCQKRCYHGRWVCNGLNAGNQRFEPGHIV